MQLRPSGRARGSPGAWPRLQPLPRPDTGAAPSGARSPRTGLLGRLADPNGLQPQGHQTRVNFPATVSRGVTPARAAAPASYPGAEPAWVGGSGSLRRDGRQPREENNPGRGRRSGGALSSRTRPACNPGQPRPAPDKELQVGAGERGAGSLGGRFRTRAQTKARAPHDARALDPRPRRAPARPPRAPPGGRCLRARLRKRRGGQKAPGLGGVPRFWGAVSHPPRVPQSPDSLSGARSAHSPRRRPKSRAPRRRSPPVLGPEPGCMDAGAERGPRQAPETPLPARPAQPELRPRTRMPAAPVLRALGAFGPRVPSGSA